MLSKTPNISELKSFSIKGLFGFKDIKIPFDKKAIILISENGKGKTTILNTLYYSINCEFDKLKTIDFDSVVLNFHNDDIIEIKKNELDTYYKNDILEEVMMFLKPYIPQGFLDNIKKRLKQIDTYKSFSEELPKLVYKYPKRKLVEKYLLDDFLKEIRPKFEDKQYIYNKNKTEENKITIKENIKECIFYFPTYRRIEEDLKSLGYKEDKSELLNFYEEEDKLIQFGMQDVSDKFEEITKQIKDSALNLYSKVTGEILTQLLDGSLQITQEMRDSIKPETLNIVLSRIGEMNIEKLYSENIEKLVESGDINLQKYEQLVYFLSKLVNLYEQQKEKDESIKKFADVCNKYLNEKHISYDEANVNISIVQNRNNNKIDIKNLSSGEKQIISIFSKIYLESSKDFILLFDEPELSLSIEWQKLLLPDILESGKCKLLLAVTHSPFIFDNELDLNAKELDDFIQEK